MFVRETLIMSSLVHVGFYILGEYYGDFSMKKKKKKGKKKPHTDQSLVKKVKHHNTHLLN